VPSEIEAEPRRRRAASTGTVAVLTLDRFSQLAGWTSQPCVSIYATLHSRHVDAAAIMLEDLTRSARQQLEELALDSGWFPSLEQLGVDLADVDGHRGLAMFAAPGMSVVFWLDVELPELAHVADRFVVTPLIAALPAIGHCHLLALSQHQLRLFRGDHAGLEQVHVPDMPSSIADALWYEDPERRVSWHGGAHIGAGRVGMIVHGSGSEHDGHAHLTDRRVKVEGPG
jgi:Bacterial archaeo-eukaryotic release factor family 7